jgi:amino acid adenylation domain-containing protein
MNPWATKGQDELSQLGNPLSVSQERLWVLDQLHPHNPAQNLASGLRLAGQLDQEALASALDDVVRRHDVLRTEFHAIAGIPAQALLPSSRLTLNRADLRHLSPEERELELSRLAQQETQKPFDLSHAPLLRATLFRLADAEHVFLVVAHRIVCDEISAGLLLNELASFYKSCANRKDLPAAASSLQYREFAVRRTAPAAEHLAYWKQRLAGPPSSVDLPTDRPRPPVQTFRGVEQRMRIESALLERLQDLSRNQGATLFVTLLAAFNVLLFRYSRQDDLIVGTRVPGRDHPDSQMLIGPLENMIVFRTDLSGDPSFNDVLLRVREIAHGAFSHQVAPFETLVEQLSLDRDLSRNPLFQIFFSMQDLSLPNFPIGLQVSPFHVAGGTAEFDLSVKCTANENHLKVTFSYNTDLFDASTIERMMGHFRILLESGVEDPGARISRIPLLSETERHQLIVTWNDTQVQYPTNIPLNKFIESQVEKTPESIALIYESDQLTYRQLNSRANQLARHLKKLGVGPDVLVAVFAERSVEMVIALLATIKAGGAYVPLDPEYPKERLEAMLRDANPPVLLTQAHLLDLLPTGVPHLICLDRDWDMLQAERLDDLPGEALGKNLAYAIYTSGSTGKPKGVPNVHEAIVNRLLWMQSMYKLTATDRVLQKTPYSFDVSVWEFFWPLMTGAALVVARPGGHRDPTYLVDLIAKQDITTIHFVPSMLGIFLETGDLERCRTLRQVFTSGEALPFDLQQRFFEHLGAELHNLYGPTEAAVDVTYWACRSGSPQTIVPIGRPIANTQIYILDAELQPVPIGVAGELHIGGVGLARGYLNRPDLTAQKFIPNPFSQQPDARLYKTGDLARFLTDGNIEYLGRIDNQIKLRGFRIELGEIETVLAECAEVRQAVVVLREDTPGDKRLVAYLTASSRQSPDTNLLRKHAAEKLPEFMVPSKFVVLDAFPMITSGKVDRRALPAPARDERDFVQRVAPRNEIESALVSIFEAVLGIPSVGVTDNFFDLGGHSLLAARLLAEVEKVTGQQMPLSALFRQATVESLAQALQETPAGIADPVAMEIQPGSAGLPFFAIVPPGEDSLGYAILARHMGLHQKVYKIQGHAPIVRQRPYSEQEMQSLAGEYVAAMRAVQPEGPYCLGGLCDGAHIAERVVLELEAQGHMVGLFAVIDTWVLQNSQRPWLWRVDYFRQRLREAGSRSLAKQIQLYKRAVANQLRKLTGKVSARSGWGEVYWPHNYTPTSFRAPVFLFKRPNQPFYYVKDPQMGWGARTTTVVEIHEIDFDHLQLLREPHVRVLGEKLAACIQRVSNQEGLSRESEEIFSGQHVTSDGRSG